MGNKVAIWTKVALYYFLRRSLHATATSTVTLASRIDIPMTRQSKHLHTTNDLIGLFFVSFIRSPTLIHSSSSHHNTGQK